MPCELRNTSLSMIWTDWSPLMPALWPDTEFPDTTELLEADMPVPPLSVTRLPDAVIPRRSPRYHRWSWPISRCWR